MGGKRAVAGRVMAVIVLLLALSATGAEVRAQGGSLPGGFQASLVAGTLLRPTAMNFAPDGRLFVTQQAGALRVIENGVLLPDPFLTVNVNSAGERGLLGVAFDPNFASNQYLYIYYTTQAAPIHNRVSRFTADGNVAVPGSETILLELDNLSSATNHNGGALHFGPDGKLYIAVGENANGSNAQSFSNLLGKMLRLNSDGTIPPDNPFYGTASGKNRAIWTLGLRNPFTFAFQPGTGRMFINDVGQSNWEEINDGIAGSNYGWPATEGYTTNPVYRSPLHAYPHTGGGFTACAITGGAFYNPVVEQFPADYVGDYFFADYCGQWIRKYDPVTDSVTDFASNTAIALVDLKVTSDGSLYYLARGNSSNTGVVYRIQYAPNLTPPSITEDPQDQLLAMGETAAFSCGAQGSAPLAYQWQRDTVNIPGAVLPTYTIPSVTLGDDGALFRCVVTNTIGSATSAEALLTVVAGSRPEATITEPLVGALYQAGDSIAFAGTASDADDGLLPASAFTWEVLLHHDSHTHPQMDPTSGITSGSFDTPTASHASINVWYRIYLTVTDSTGLTRSVFRDIHPEIASVTVNTAPVNLQLMIDGTPFTAPVNRAEIVGTIWALEAISPQTIGTTRWEFAAWSDGGAQVHDVTMPAGGATYTAAFMACAVISESANAAPGRNYSTSDSFTLTWNRLTWAASYEVMVDNSASFTTPEYHNTAIPGDQTSVTLTGLTDCTYYWRVRGLTATGQPGAWSARDSFIIDATP